MRYEIFGCAMPGISIQLDKGESVYTQTGGMSWMTEGIDMDTNIKGGLLKGIGRLFNGESLFMVTYTSERDNAEITFSSTMPGEIKAFEVSAGNEYIAQKNAFLCATPNVEISTAFTNTMAGFFGGEGFIMQRYSGNGTVFLELDGSIKEYSLLPGETLKVNTGNVVAFESTVKYSSKFIKGFSNILFGGEGLFLSTLTGPGKVYLQTMTVAQLAARIVPFIPIPPASNNT